MAGQWSTRRDVHATGPCSAIWRQLNDPPGRPLLPTVGHANSWLAGVGIVLTVIYAAAVILRPQRRIVRLGSDSIVVVVLFVIGIIGLLAVTH